MKRIKDQIKEIERQEARLARKKKALEDKAKKSQEVDKKLDQLVKSSGYKNPKDLVHALIDKFGVRVSAKRTAGATTTGGTRRKRTRMTPELRDSIKKDLKSGTSMNQVAKKLGISYAVILKVNKGEYDKLK